eukprot:scaffold66927_cov42-Phaeocystis_antarctica.AAC.2
MGVVGKWCFSKRKTARGSAHSKKSRARPAGRGAGARHGARVPCRSRVPRKQKENLNSGAPRRSGRTRQVACVSVEWWQAARHGTF